MLCVCKSFCQQKLAVRAKGTDLSPLLKRLDYEQMTQGVIKGDNMAVPKSMPPDAVAAYSTRP